MSEPTTAPEARPSTRAVVAARPRPVTVTFWLYAGTLALGFVTQIVSVLGGDPMILAAGFVSLAIDVVLLVFLRRGANWARVLRTIRFVATAVFLLLLVPSELTTLPLRAALGSTAVTAVVVALLVVMLVLLYRPASNAWFRAVTAAKEASLSRAQVAAAPTTSPGS